MPQADIQPFGDAAVLASPRGVPDADARRLVVSWATACRQQPLVGVTDLVPAFGLLGVCFDPSLLPGIASPLVQVADWLQRGLDAAADTHQEQSREHTLPVIYGGPHGPDLQAVAEQAGMTAAGVIELHSATTYTVGAVGFTPGFGYLEGLPEVLHTPRRATPRVSAPAGAVGIGGPYTGAYPSQSPGGWNLIGRTPTRLFDPTNDPPAVLRPGDRVRFSAVTPEEFATLEMQQVRPLRQMRRQVDVFEVVSPGAQTILQDLGRRGWRSVGVTDAGAMDPLSLRLANLLAGNDEYAVALEASLTGPLLKCVRDVVVGLAGALPEALGRPRRRLVRCGQQLDLRGLTGGRAYLAVAGGLATHRVLGSGSTDLIAGWGGLDGRALQVGDRLGVEGAPAESVAPHPVDGKWSILLDHITPVDAGEVVLRCLPGPQRELLPTGGWEGFLASSYRVGRQSSRMGVRLEGPSIGPRDLGGMTSQPVVPGAIQVPPDGQPIVLGADCQTLGGYPVVACVASVDLSRLGQLRPGDRVRFVEVTLDEADQLRHEADAQLRRAAAGIAAHAP